MQEVSCSIFDRYGLNRSRFVIFIIFAVFAILRYLAQFDFLGDMVITIIALLPFITLVLFLIWVYLKERRSKQDLFLTRNLNFFLKLLLKISAAMFILFVVFFPSAWRPVWMFLFSLSSFFTLETFFLLAAYFSVIVVAAGAVFVAIRFYQIERGTYAGTANQLVKKTLYSVFFILFFLLALSAKAYPQAYAPLTGAVSDIFYSFMGKSDGVQGGSIFSTLVKAFKATKDNLATEISSSNANLSTNLAASKNNLFNSINETSNSLSDDIKKRVSEKGGDISGSLTLSEDLTVEGDTTLRDVVPDKDDTYDLGSSSKGWNNVYVHRLIGSSPLTIGSGSSSHSLTSSNDLIISGMLEVNGDVYFDGNVYGANLGGGDYLPLAGGTLTGALVIDPADADTQVNLSSGGNVIFGDLASNSISDSASFSFIGGGDNNILDEGADESVILGGCCNSIASSWGSIILGGDSQLISGSESAIIAGYSNTITRQSSFIGGGTNNTITSNNSFIGGGNHNTSNGQHSFIGSGIYNQISSNGFSNAIIGGSYNTIQGSSQNSIILGGKYDLVTATNAVVIGSGVNVNNKLVNDVSNSLMVGFNSDIPTFFVGPSSGVGTTGGVGIGTEEPSEILDVNGRLHIAQTSAPGDTGDKLYNVDGTLYWDGIALGGGTPSQWTTNDSDIYYNLGNVGIGTDLPGAALEVKSAEADSDSAVASIIDTSSAWTTAGSKLLSLRNDGDEEMFVDNLGGIWSGKDAAYQLGSGRNPGNGGSFESWRDISNGDPNFNEMWAVLASDSNWTNYANFDTYGGNVDTNPYWTTYTAASALGHYSSIWDLATPTTAKISILVDNASRTNLEPSVTDGANAIAYLFDTSNELVTAGAKLLSLRNDGTEVLNVGRSGELYISPNQNTDQDPLYVTDNGYSTNDVAVAAFFSSGAGNSVISANKFSGDGSILIASDFSSTAANSINIAQYNSVKTGNLFYADMGIDPGSFTGDFLNFNVNSANKFRVDAEGRLFMSETSAPENTDGMLYNVDGTLYWDGTALESTQLNGYINAWFPKGLDKSWTSIAISSDGQYQTATANNDQLYISSDYGQTWAAKGPTKPWANLTMSSDGQYQTAYTDINMQSNQLYISSDYGQTWTAEGPVEGWTSLAMSSNGQYQAAGMDRGDVTQIHVSSDYGQTWTAKGSVKLWTSIAMSSNGQYLTAGANNNNLSVSSDYGQTWTNKGPGKVWTKIALSSDGQYQTATANNDQLYISSDYGQTWAAKGPTGSWTSLAMSSDGQYQSAGMDGNQLYVSSDFGQTWTAEGLSKDWTSMAMSSDGQYHTAGTNNDQLYVFGNTLNVDNLAIGTTNPSYKLDVQGGQINASGGLCIDGDCKTSWNAITLVAGNISAGEFGSNTGGGDYSFSDNVGIGGVLTISGTGDSSIAGNVGIGTINPDYKLDVQGGQINSSGGLCIDGDCKISWDSIFGGWAVVGPTKSWSGLVMSSDGKYQTASADDDHLYVSSDYGQTWTAEGPVKNWHRGVAMSSNGQYQTAGASGDQIYISSDYGQTWTAEGVTNSWQGVAMSGDGQYQAVGTDNDHLYVSSDYGQTWTVKSPVSVNGNLWAIAISADGHYQTASNDGDIQPMKTYVSSDYGNTWTYEDNGLAFDALAMSANGQYQTGAVLTWYAHIYLSSDYGQTWDAVATPVNSDWHSIVMSPDGKIQMAAGGFADPINPIYISTDYGQTWTTEGPDSHWTAIAMSSDGNIRAAVDGWYAPTGHIYVYNQTLHIKNDKIGIGDVTPVNTLDVTGSICAKNGTDPDCTGTTAGNIYADNFIARTGETLPDYVFEQGYNLMPLADLKAYIAANQHLPGIPSAEEVAQNGLDLGQMVQGLLQKTEENTLYILQNNEQIQTIDNTLVLNGINDNVDDLETSTENSIGKLKKNMSDISSQLDDITAQQTADAALLTALQEQIKQIQALTNQDLVLAKLDNNNQSIDLIRLTLGLDRVANVGDVDILGQLSAQTLETGGIVIKVSDVEAPTIGQAAIKKGEINIIIPTKAADLDSRIYITPTTSTAGEIPYVGEIKAKESFEIKIDKAADSDIDLNWWIVSQK